MSFGKLGALGRGFGRLGAPLGSAGSYNYATALGSDLLAAWDATRLDLITQSGGLVSSQKDVVAGYDAAQATGSLQPAYSSSGYNGAPTLSYDGLDDRLATATNPFAGLTSFEMWAVVSQDALAADTSGRTIISFGGAGTTAQASLRRVVTGGVNRAQSQVGNGAASISVADAAVDFSGRHVVRGRVTPTTLFFSIDGGAEVSIAATPVIGVGMCRLGSLANTTAANFWQGLLPFIAVTGPLSSQKGTAFYNYLLNTRRRP